MNRSILVTARRVACVRRGRHETVCGMIGTRNLSSECSPPVGGEYIYDDGRAKLEACLEHFHKGSSFGEVSVSVYKMMIYH